MKKITLFAFALFSVGAIAQTSISGNTAEITASGSSSAPERTGAEIVLTNSNNPVDVTDGGVACWNSGDGTYSENSFFRSYDLTDYGVTDGDFNISSLEFGQGSADDGKELFLNVYVADNIDLEVATLVFVDGVLHTASSADDLSLVTVPADITVPGGSIVVFEVNAGDSGANAGETYFPGNNGDGETAPSYLQAADCGVNVPTPVADVAGQESYVMNVVGEPVLSVGENALSQVSIYPNPASDVLNINAPASVEVTGVAIYDVLGKKSNVSMVNGQINVSGLANGVYILSLETSAGTLTEKIVKN
ncbi:T9SS type A sorting domain-containing protein [Marixanthomonas spongiae]|nr:T9SS type A sorting domain-containing protein [Marixanthomonas spongiae]